MAASSAADVFGPTSPSTARSLSPWNFFTAAVVTTDAVGHGRLSLSTIDEDAPLPVELQPIEDLRLVAWLRGDGAVVLSGSFTGTNQVGQRQGGRQSRRFHAIEVDQPTDTMVRLPL